MNTKLLLMRSPNWYALMEPPIKQIIRINDIITFLYWFIFSTLKPAKQFELMNLEQQMHFISHSNFSLANLKHDTCLHQFNLHIPTTPFLDAKESMLLLNRILINEQQSNQNKNF